MSQRDISDKRGASVAKDLSLKEAEQIMARQHPRSDAYYKGDQATIDDVDRAYQKAYPGETNRGELFDDEVGGEGAPEAPEGQGEAEKGRAMAEAELRSRWGPDYTAKFEAAASVLHHLGPELVRTIEERYPTLGNDPDLLNALAEISLRLK